jgi:hypothetical protein
MRKAVGEHVIATACDFGKRGWLELKRARAMTDMVCVEALDRLKIGGPAVPQERRLRESFRH